MTLDPLYLFVFAGLFSPGPNVVMITASGARFGVLRSLPHLFGIVVGVGVTAGVTGLGVGALIAAAPRVEQILKIAAAVWILILAWKMWQSAGAPRNAQTDGPMRFWQAVLFQWVNPKVWAVAWAAISGYSAGFSPLGEALRLASAFSGLNLFVCIFWVSAGGFLAYLLRNPVAWRNFIRAMSLVLAATAVPIFLT